MIISLLGSIMFLYIPESYFVHFFFSSLEIVALSIDVAAWMCWGHVLIPDCGKYIKKEVFNKCKISLWYAVDLENLIVAYDTMKVYGLYR